MDRKTFTSVNNWIESIAQHASPDIPKILVGNKCDLAEEREVKKEEAESLALNHNLHYYETSARENINIEESMYDLFEQTIERKFSGLAQSAMTAAHPQQNEVRESVMIKGKQHR